MGGNFSLLNDGTLPDGVTPQVNNVTPQVTCGQNTQLNEFTKQCVGAFDAESYCGTNTAVSDEKCVADKTAICGVGTRYDDKKSRCMIDKYELGPGVKLNSQNVAQVDDNIFTASVVWDPVNAAVTASSSVVSSFCNSERNAVYDVSSDMCVADTANLLAQKCTAAKNLRYNADDDTCESTHATTNGNAFCGTNTALDEGKCKASAKACDSNAMTFDATAAKCALAEGACGTGTILKDDECVADVSACATENMVFDDDKKTCVVNKCPGGTKLVNGQCEHDVSSTLLAEVEGDATTGFKCQAKIDSVCGEGTAFDDNTNTCQVKADVCAKGSAFQNGRCVDALPNEIKARIRDGHMNTYRPWNDNGNVAAYSVYCDTEQDSGRAICGRALRTTAGEWRWEKVHQDKPLDDEYYLFAPDGKQCEVGNRNGHSQTLQFYCYNDAKATDDKFIFKVNKLSKHQDPWNGQVGESIYMKSKVTGKYCALGENTCNGGSDIFERMGLDPKPGNDSWFPNPFIHAKFADTTSSAKKIVRGYQQNHMMPASDMAESIEECREYGKRRGAQVVGFRDSNHSNPDERNTCFYFKKAEDVYHDTGDSSVHTSMCTAEYYEYPKCALASQG